MADLGTAPQRRPEDGRIWAAPWTLAHQLGRGQSGSPSLSCLGMWGGEGRGWEEEKVGEAMAGGEVGLREAAAMWGGTRVSASLNRGGDGELGGCGCFGWASAALWIGWVGFLLFHSARARRKFYFGERWREVARQIFEREIVGATDRSTLIGPCGPLTDRYFYIRSKPSVPSSLDPTTNVITDCIPYPL